MVEITPARKDTVIFDQYYETILLSFAKHYLNHDELSTELNKDNIQLLPIFVDGRLIATCTLCIEKYNSETPYYASVHRVTVDPEFRGFGYGYLANKNAFEYAKQIGCKQIYCSVVTNVEGKGGGNNPNLRELNICINKLGYKPTGFRFVDLPDFSRIEDKQYTSTIVVWRDIDDEKESHYDYSLAKLFDYYNDSKNFVISGKKPDKLLTMLSPKKTGAEVAISPHIEHFSHSNFLPTYFLPRYGENGETIFFGFKYYKILTRVASGTNIADINYEELGKCVYNRKLLNLAKSIQRRIVERSEITYSDPSVKIKNI